MFERFLTFFTDALTEVGAVLINLFTSITKIFYNDGFTFFGVVFIIMFGVSIIIFGINFVISLIGGREITEEDDDE